MLPNTFLLLAVHEATILRMFDSIDDSAVSVNGRNYTDSPVWTPIPHSLVHLLILLCQVHHFCAVTNGEFGCIKKKSLKEVLQNLWRV